VGGQHRDSAWEALPAALVQQGAGAEPLVLQTQVLEALALQTLAQHGELLAEPAPVAPQPPAAQ
jgi:hypothetical protein